MNDKAIFMALGAFAAGLATAFFGSEEVKNKTLVAAIAIKHIKEDKQAIRQIMKNEIEDMKTSGQIPDFLNGQNINYDMSIYNQAPSIDEQRLQFQSMLTEAMELGIVKNNPLFDHKKEKNV